MSDTKWEGFHKRSIILFHQILLGEELCRRARVSSIKLHGLIQLYVQCFINRPLGGASIHYCVVRWLWAGLGWLETSLAGLAGLMSIGLLLLPITLFHADDNCVSNKVAPVAPPCEYGVGKFPIKTQGLNYCFLRYVASWQIWRQRCKDENKLRKR